MVRDALKTAIKNAIEKLIAESPDLAGLRECSFDVEVPKAAGHGDFSTNVAMVGAKIARSNPRQLAESLVNVIQADPANQHAIAKVEIAGPGFINFDLNSAWVASRLKSVLDSSVDFSKPVNPSPQKINVEFVSVNPNGPITIGSGRGAAFGSALCNVLEHAGNTVHREYYINDGVNSEQMRLFAESVKAIIEGKPVPENGYKGDYVFDVASKLGNPGTLAGVDLALSEVAQTYQRKSDDAKEEWEESLAERGDTPETSILQEKFARYAGACKIWQRYADIRLRMTVTTDGEYEIDPSTLDSIRMSAEICMILAQYADLKTFQVQFDTWFSEQSLHDSGAVERVLQHLESTHVADTDPHRIKIEFAKGGAIKDVTRESQPVDEDDAAGSGQTLWLRSTKFGDDQDRVLRRKDGRLTYIASDVAYHKDKFNRPANADKLITVLGPDHHGYIGRLQAVVAAMFSDQVEPKKDDSPLNEHESVIYTSVEERNQCKAAQAWAKDHLEVQIFQLVRFLKDGKPAPMRKRDGNIYALIDLINEIGEQVRPNSPKEDQQQAGSDVARFFYLMRHHDTAMDFDLELATKQSDENPVFYVQYANARINSVIKKGDDLGLKPENPDFSLLTHEKETALILKICDLPNEVARTADDYAVNRLTTYALELARAYHGFYDSCRVVQPDQPELSKARLALCAATSKAIVSTLRLLGVSAPTELRRESKE
ncbi:arginine--tRNA ligase [Kamptonema cortianum]|nr:arginine--tRNA ligase [Geitlerinema splendidum]MDK3156943.1 arginine--tRNA ligase [Kamptonema cortianum]